MEAAAAPEDGVPVVLVVQHGADDPPGRLGRWLSEAGCRLEVVQCHADEPLPASLDRVAGLVVLGGAMGAYDDAEVPWLGATRTLLAEAVERGVATLGVCLGHQLLAVACGGSVRPALEPQLGVVGLQLTAAAATDPLFGGLAAETQVVHWNNDIVVEAPAGSVVLSTSAAGIQALRVGDHAWGLQFHPEVDPATVSGWAQADVLAGRLAADRAAARLVGIRAADAAVQRQLAPLAHGFAERVHQRGPGR